MKILMNNPFSRLVMCLLFISAGYTVNAQIIVEATEAQAALIETLNGDTDNDMDLGHQVALALKNLDKAKADKTYNDKTYDSYVYQLLDVEENLKQAAVDNRLNASKNSSVRAPKKYSDNTRAVEILKQKLKEGVIDEPTYHKRLAKLKAAKK